MFISVLLDDITMRTVYVADQSRRGQDSTDIGNAASIITYELLSFKACTTFMSTLQNKNIFWNRSCFVEFLSYLYWRWVACPHRIRLCRFYHPSYIYRTDILRVIRNREPAQSRKHDTLDLRCHDNFPNNECLQMSFTTYLQIRLIIFRFGCYEIK